MDQFTWVDKDNCIACGACGATAPNIFDFDIEGIAEVIFNGDANRGITLIPPDWVDDLYDAANGCPTSSIKIASVPFNK